MIENRFGKKMLSKDVCSFISRKKINIDAKQISYDVIDFRNMFRTKFIEISNTNNILELKFKEVVSKNGKRIEFNMICCDGDKSHSEFLLGETEVTQELYELVMGYNPSYFKAHKDSSQRPVELVTWYDAILFCNKLSLLTNKSPYYEIKGIEYADKTQTNIKKANVEINEGANGFRLPLSEEWKYAAKAGTNNLYAGTNDDSRLEEYAWFSENSHRQTHPVATKKPNEWGFYDMIGNVSEWCGDKYNNNSVSRDVRGGDSVSDALFLRYAGRSTYSPDTRGGYLGFRVSAPLVN